MPQQGFLVADHLTLVIFTKLFTVFSALSELVSFDQVKGYLLPLMDRPAAKESQFFDALAESVNVNS